jgi:2-polyprenyl-3-methyl-5-hydroxy-6-metoxy-1,4-benzoquinol methylase
MPLVASTVSTPCVLCGSNDIEELSRRARDGRPLRTTICRRCGLVWANPPPVKNAVRTYYSDEYRRDYKGTPSRTLPQIYHAGLGALARYRAIRHLLAADEPILDVGCGGGELVYLLRRLGFDATGIEPDRSYSEAARSVLGLPVQTGFIQDLDFPQGAFGTILMYHVLEHVDTPIPVLARLRDWMKDDGVLVVEVPNIEARFEAPITRFHVAHLFYYSPATLEAVARKSGFEVEDVRLPPDGGTIVGTFRRSAAAPLPALSADTYRHTRDILDRHTNVRYYSSRTPYVRMARRLATYCRKQIIARRMTTGKDTLDTLFKDVPTDERTGSQPPTFAPGRPR